MRNLKTIALGMAVTVLAACSGLMQPATEGSEWDNVPVSIKKAPLPEQSNLAPIEVKTVSGAVTKQLDTLHPLLPETETHTARLRKIAAEFFPGASVDIRVYDLPSTQIVSLPNGEMRVHSGLVDLLDDKELIAILAHEIAHIRLGHVRAKLEQAHFAAAAVHAKLVANKINTSEQTESLTSSLESAIGIALVDTPYTATQETEADTLALSLLAKTPIPMKALQTALQKLNAEAGETLYASAHPNIAIRMKALHQEIDAFHTMIGGTDDPARSTSASQVLLAQAATEVAGQGKTAVTADNCSGDLIAAAYPNSRTGWYVLSQPFQDKFDAELQTLEIRSMASDYSIVRLGKMKAYHVLVGPFYRKEYATRNFEEFVASGVIDATACTIHVKGKTIKQAPIRAEG